MAYKKEQHTVTLEAVGILEMQSMADDDYTAYVTRDLTFIDHHGVLRSAPGEFPIACTRKQLDVYIAYLQAIRDQLPT